MGNYFNDDEFQGVETVKISANSKRNKGAKMVGGVPMATIYQGMSVRRLNVLNRLDNEAYDTTYRAWIDRGDWPHRNEREFNNEYKAEFSRLCERAATKAGWHANRRAARNNHPTSKTNKKGK
jgi:hypothetical protein